MKTLKRCPLATKIPTGAIGIDITVKNAKPEHKCMAPTWDMVMGHKSKKMSDKEYTVAYEKIINNNIEKILNLLNNTKEDIIYFKCFCADGKFCHTYILIDYLTNNYSKLFKKG
jgi:uncharacterized protein YeaO (DUF488 family)